MTVKLLTFGYTNGKPDFPEEVEVIDVRSIPDPANKFKGTDGKNKEVQDWLMSYDKFPDFREKLMEFVTDGSVIAFGDGGGLYRSVAMAEISKRLIEENLKLEVEVLHRDLDKVDIGYGKAPKSANEEAFGYTPPLNLGSDDLEQDDDSDDDDDDGDGDDEKSFDEAVQEHMEAWEQDTDKTPKKAGVLLKNLLEEVENFDDTYDPYEFQKHVSTVADYLKAL